MNPVTKDHYMIGVMIDAVVNPYQRNLSEELIHAADKLNARLVFFLGGRIHSGSEPEDKMQFVYDLISADTIDGLIIVSTSLICDESTLKEFINKIHPVPVISIGNKITGIPAINLDNSDGIRQILRHMIQVHHDERFAFISGIENHPDAIIRYQTFLSCLKENGLNFDPKLYYAGDFDLKSGSDAVDYFLRECDSGIDVIVAANDDMAIGVIEELQKMGKRVPEDIRVTGFDNIPDSSFCVPGLTTVGQPFSSMAQKSIEFIINLIHKNSVPEEILFPTDLLVRDSCGCFPRIIINNQYKEILSESDSNHQSKIQKMKEKILEELMSEYSSEITSRTRNKVFKFTDNLLIFITNNEVIDKDLLIDFNEIIDDIIIESKSTNFLEALVDKIDQSISILCSDSESLRRSLIIMRNIWGFLSKKMLLASKSYQYRLEREATLLQYFRATTFYDSLEENIVSSIEYFISRLGIKYCFLAKFINNPEQTFNKAQIILSHIPETEVEVSKAEFPSRTLIPRGLRSIGEKSHWIVEAVSLYYRMGFMLFDLSNKNLLLYSQIRSIVSANLQEATIFRQVQKQTADLQEQSDELKKNVEYLRTIMGAVIQTLAMTVEAKDPYTAGHERRVADLARTIAHEMNLSFEQIEAVRLSAVVHDLGKLYVPSEILNKPGKLYEAEFLLIKMHPQIAFDILKNITFPWPLAEIVYQHHERLDGSGYPQGLKGSEIRLEAQIIAVADVVEAIATHRPYRPSLGIEVAIKEIQEYRGIRYNSDVVDICSKLFLEKGYQLKAQEML
jgi:HD-GYP domain-containing protein (c-di-GMP phosphodiesterase class II)